MPAMPKRQCKKPGCFALTQERNGYCTAHVSWRMQQIDAGRQSRKIVYNARWRAESAAFLRANPLCMCELCKAGELRTTRAVLVDHIVPHDNEYDLFWNPENWQSMSKACHDRKTVLYDGGFGRQRRQYPTE
jgi:5-methylcytosine-specific restriction protein A